MNATLQDVTVVNARAGADGGAVAVRGQGSFRNVSVANATASRGGAVFVAGVVSVHTALAWGSAPDLTCFDVCWNTFGKVLMRAECTTAPWSDAWGDGRVADFVTYDSLAQAGPKQVQGGTQLCTWAPWGSPFYYSAVCGGPPSRGMRIRCDGDGAASEFAGVRISSTSSLQVCAHRASAVPFQFLFLRSASCTAACDLLNVLLSLPPYRTTPPQHGGAFYVNGFASFSDVHVQRSSSSAGVRFNPQRKNPVCSVAAPLFARSGGHSQSMSRPNPLHTHSPAAALPSPRAAPSAWPTAPSLRARRPSRAGGSTLRQAEASRSATRPSRSAAASGHRRRAVRRRCGLACVLGVRLLSAGCCEAVNGKGCELPPAAGAVAVMDGEGATITGCRFQNNSLSVALSSACAHPTPMAPCDTFTDAFETGSGGGLYVWATPLALSDSFFEGNSAPRGGGVHISAAGAPGSQAAASLVALLSNVSLTANAGGNGSALSLASAAATADRLAISGNAGENGAVLLGAQSSLALSNSTGARNTAQRGGFLFAEAGSRLVTASCSFSDNFGVLGGAFYLEDPRSADGVAGALISGNRAVAGGVAFVPNSQPAPRSISAGAADANVTIVGNAAECWGSTLATGDFSATAEAPPVRSGGAADVTVTLLDGYNQTVAWLPDSSVIVTSALPVLGRPAINGYAANQSLSGVQLTGNESQSYRLAIVVKAPLLPAGGVAADLDAVVAKCSDAEVRAFHQIRRRAWLAFCVVPRRRVCWTNGRKLLSA